MTADLIARLAADGGLVSPIDDAHRAAEPLAPRSGSVAGRTVVLLDINKNRGAEFLDRVEHGLVQRGATTMRLTKQIFSLPAAPEIIAQVADRGDLAVQGLAD